MARKRPAKQSTRARARQRGAIALAVALLLGVVINLKVFVWDRDTSIEKVREMALAGGAPSPAAAPAPVVEAGDPADDPGAWTEGEVARGDTLGRILRQRGVPTADADAILRALEPHADLRLIRPGQGYRIHTREDGKVDVFELVLAAERKVAVARTADGFAAAAETKRTDVRLEEVGGTITSSLYGAVRRAGEDTRLVAVLVDLFAYDLDFYNDQHEGDSFRLLVDKEYLDGKLLRYQRVRAAEYRGKAGTFRAYYFRSPDGKVDGYFRDKGEGVEKTFLKTPLKFARISSRFDRKRMHPILHRRTAHLGVDYAAPVGTPVWAAGPGRIVTRGPQGPAGNLVAIDHGNGYTTVYMHLSRFQNGQKVGQRVKQKTVIGYVGTTGRSTGPHLHFSIKKNGAFIDPMTVKMTPGPGIPRAYRAAFDAEVAGLTARLAAVSVQARAPDAPEDDGSDEADEPALPEAPE
jgi:murein DD-endopeptidase MepM/ murein hydrolase activator NlpD